MEKKHVPKLSTEASTAAEQDQPLTKEEIMMAMEIAARIRERIDSGALAREDDEIPIKEENKVNKTTDEKATGKPDDASKEEKKPPA